MKLFILGFYLVLVLTYLEDGKANRTWGRSKASNTGTTRSRLTKATSTKSSTFSKVSLPNKSYSKKPQVSQPKLDKVKFDPKKVFIPGQGRKLLKQTNKITPKNKQKVADIKASLRKFVANKKSGIHKQNDNIKVPSLKKKTKKTTQDIKAALNKYLKNKKSSKPTTNLKTTKANSHSTIASALRSFVTKQKGVNTGSSNKPRKLPRRICKRSTSRSDCELPDLNDDKKKPTLPLKTEASRKQYLTDKEIKFNEKGLIGTVEKHGKDIGPDVIFLEEGTSSAGLIHILDGHREDFKNSFVLQGSTTEEIDSQIKEIILRAAGTKSVEKAEQRPNKDGKEQKEYKMVKEVEWKGVTKRMNLAIGSNGFIVTSYPESSDKAPKHKPEQTEAEKEKKAKIAADKKALKKKQKEAANLAKNG